MRNLMETNQKMAMATATNRIKNDMVGIMQFLGTPKGKLAQIELLTIFTAILLLFFVIFGSYRRRCSGEIFRFICFVTYNLSSYVLTYALTLVREIPFRNGFFPHWLGYLVTIIASSNSFSAFSLEDNDQWKSYSWQRAINLFWVYWLLGLSPNPSAGMALDWLFFILALTSDRRAQALRAASERSLERNTKKIADYMSEKHENPSEVDTVEMERCNYLVRGEENLEKRGPPAFVRAGRRILRRIARICPRRSTKMEARRGPGDQTPLENEDQLITVEKVWTCEGRLLSSDTSNKLKDMCLSFALFKLLRLKYAGYSLPQEAYKKTRKLIVSKEDDYNRAFRVIEVELTFLFDFFYTKYSIIFEPRVQLLNIMGLIIFVYNIQSMTSFLIDYQSYAIDYHSYANDYHLGTMLNGLSVDVFMTIVMMILFTIVQFMQLFFMGFTEWAKVTLICNYVQRKSWQNLWVDRIIRAICEVQLINPWERKLHQYSFLKSYSYKPCWFKKSKLMAIYIDLTRDGQKQSKPIKLPEEVKQAVFKALKSNDGTKLENGQASLKLDDVSKELLWACHLKTQTQVIMVWHIATSFCEEQQPVGGSEKSEMQRDFLVATSLSEYLAYLVAFTPQLLPDHPYVVEYVFDNAIIEAREFFGGCKRMKDRVQKMKGNCSGSFEREETVINRGAWLGHQFTTKIKHKENIWRILAAFWAEIVLYVAPSDNAKAHADHLSRGGEFVTHLWALLSHSGFERDSPTEPRQAHAGSERDPPTEPRQAHAGSERDPPTEPRQAHSEPRQAHVGFEPHKPLKRSISL